jgi:hypothetical protein
VRRSDTLRVDKCLTQMLARSSLRLPLVRFVLRFASIIGLSAGSLTIFALSFALHAGTTTTTFGPSRRFSIISCGLSFAKILAQP